MPPVRRPLLLALCLGVCLGASPACVEHQPQFTLDRRPIINGSIDTTHQSVVALVYTSYGSMEQFCTGTVIARRWVLTAGHCYKESGFPPSQTKIFIGQTVGSGGQTINIANAYVHPQYYLASNGAPVNDVAVVELTQDAPVPAMAWQQTSLGNIVGQTVTLVGYGVTNAATQTGNGTRRTTDQLVSDQDSMYIYYQGGSSGTCQGDSGGPMFMHGATETVVGVTSFGDASCVQLGANTRVDIYADFIQQYAGSASTTPQPVTVGFVQPQHGSTQGSAITVEINAQTTAGVNQVELYLDGTLTNSLGVAPWTFSLLGVAAGPHTIRAVATGNDGGTGEAAVSVTVVTGGQCSTQTPCTTGYDCVDGQCVVHTPPGGCNEQSPCLPGFHCESAVCVANAPPPPGTPGAACTQNTQCQSGMCVDGTTDHGYCTEACGSNQDCHNEAACLDLGDIMLCGPAYSALPTGLVGGPRELVGGCRAAPRGPAAPPASLALLLLGLALRRSARRR